MFLCKNLSASVVSDKIKQFSFLPFLVYETSQKLTFIFCDGYLASDHKNYLAVKIIAELECLLFSNILIIYWLREKCKLIEKKIVLNSICKTLPFNYVQLKKKIKQIKHVK